MAIKFGSLVEEAAEAIWVGTNFEGVLPREDVWLAVSDDGRPIVNTLAAFRPPEWAGQRSHIESSVWNVLGARPDLARSILQRKGERILLWYLLYHLYVDRLQSVLLVKMGKGELEAGNIFGASPAALEKWASAWSDVALVCTERKALTLSDPLLAFTRSVAERRHTTPPFFDFSSEQD